MSDSESFGLSARDLMPNWVADLEKVGGENPPAPGYGAETREPRAREGDRPFGKDRGRGGHDRGRDGGRPFDRDRDRGASGGRRDFGSRDQNRGQGAPRDGERRGGPRPPWKDRGDQGQGQGQHRGQGPRGGHQGARHKGPHVPAPDPLPGVDVTLRPTKPAIEALAKHIRSTGRAYPIFDVARMVMGSRDRYEVIFRPHKAKQGETPPVEPATLFACPADGSVWLSQEEAVSHASKTRILRDYYDVEEVTTEAPKGNFTAVAVCGFSGRILGPPNHHEYQRNVQRLHRERFSDMPLERYKSRIEIHKDPETLEKWKELITKTRHYLPLTVAERAQRAAARAAEEAEKERQKLAKALAGATPGGPSPATDTAPPTDEATAGAGEETTEAAAPESEPDASPAEVEAGPEGAGESEAVPEAGTEAKADANVPEVSDPAGEPPQAEGESEAEPAPPRTILRSQEEVERHFRLHFADDAVKSVKESAVPGDVPGRLLSLGLLDKLRHECDQQRKGFPLKLIQELCQAFESQGLRFFKRGKKALFVTIAKPRYLPEDQDLTDRVRAIVDFVKAKPNGTVVQMLAALLPGYTIPKKGENPATREPVPGEMDHLSDLRWLVMEGYLIEYPDSKLEIARSHPPQAPAKAAETPAPADAGTASASEPPEPDSEPLPADSEPPPTDDQGEIPLAESPVEELGDEELSNASLSEPEPESDVDLVIESEIVEESPSLVETETKTDISTNTEEEAPEALSATEDPVEASEETPTEPQAPV